MRAVILIIGILLQEAIALNSGCELEMASNSVTAFLGIGILISFGMDVVELISKAK